MSRLRIVFLDAGTIGAPPNLQDLTQLGDLILHDFSSQDQVIPRLSEAQVVISNKVKIGAKELAQLPDLRLICVAATGSNNIDHTAAAQRGIPVRNVAGYSTQAVAQLTFTMLFTLAYDLIHLNEAVYDLTYSNSPGFSYWRNDFYELCGARFGIIGLGTIGRQVANIAEAYGAKVCYYSSSGEDRDPLYERMELEELLENCEVIAIHAPLNEKTYNLIAYPQLQQMRRSAYLLNLGRGGIVNEGDLSRAIDEGLIAGAAVDVYEQEPIPADHPFLKVNNKHRLLLTPHVGWASVEARMRLIDGIIANIKKGF